MDSQVNTHTGSGLVRSCRDQVPVGFLRYLLKIIHVGQIYFRSLSVKAAIAIRRERSKILIQNVLPPSWFLSPDRIL